MAYAPTIFLRAFLLFQVQPLGKTEKALQYIHLDARSEFASNLLPGVYLREGKIADAKSASQRMSKNPAWYGSLLQACLERSDIAAARRANQAALMAERDPATTMRSNLKVATVVPATTTASSPTTAPDPVKLLTSST